MNVGGRGFRSRPEVWRLTYTLPVVVPPALIAILAFVVVTRRYGPAASDGETRCRRCDYILRGLSIPRCPECGEAI